MNDPQALRLIGLVISAALLVILVLAYEEQRRAGPDPRGYSRWYRIGTLLMLGAASARVYCYAWALHLELPGDVTLTGAQVDAWLFTLSASWWLAAAAVAAWCRALIYRSWRIIYARERQLDGALRYREDESGEIERPPTRRRRSTTMHREEHKREH